MFKILVLEKLLLSKVKCNSDGLMFRNIYYYIVSGETNKPHYLTI